MSPHNRILPPEPVATLRRYIEDGGREGLDHARALASAGVIEAIAAAGLRGRGGAGFPTGVKWQTVADNRSDVVATTVVVNGAEGEPGTFKDRTILRSNPYLVLEGALIAAHALGADTIVVALKRSFTTEIERVRGALAEIDADGWCEGIGVSVFEGPAEYLYGEETALLEALAGRRPLPRVAPPFRRGVDEVVGTGAGVADGHGGSAAQIELAGPDGLAPPTLVNNVETLANVPGILRHGPDWFRSVGTSAAPGTVVCTVTGATRRHGVGEFALGTPLSEVIDSIGGGPRDGHRIVAVLPGASAGALPSTRLDVPLTYEDLAAAGSGLGSAGFIVLDDATDLVAVAAGISRFLAIESCGQCTPCKQDGLAIAATLVDISLNEIKGRDVDDLDRRLGTVADGARCNLARQQEEVLTSLLELFPEALAHHLDGSADPAEPELAAEIIDIVDGVAVLDEDHRRKQPDWTYGGSDSGQSPADR
ncbi:MAG: NADH-ubiquinone oxidoreductase-F iron-sulfur binding region domain-containing protein [Acidimicrobiia bacterium]